MSDFLSRLAGRSLGIEPVVQPIIPAVTAPPKAEAGFAEAEMVRETDAQERGTPPPVPGARVAPEALELPRVQAMNVPSLPRRESPALPGMQEDGKAIPGATPVLADDSRRSERREEPVEASVPAWDDTLSDRTTAPWSPPPAPMAEGRREAVAASAPIVRVTIGRVEVRAEMGSSKTRPAAAPRAKAALSLDDYLKQRVEGRR